jgi:hypothetical protein
MDNPSAQHVLQRISAATCFGCTNSYCRAVQKDMKSVDTTAECSKGSQTLQIINTKNNIKCVNLGKMYFMFFAPCVVIYNIYQQNAPFLNI